MNYYSLISSMNKASAFDADATAFITAASITDATQKSAINQLVLDLKTANIWTKMKAIYPFVGGTALTHKWNLKDPRDLDAAYRLVFSGGWTHSSTGALPNGTTAYADTKLKPSLTQILNSNGFGIYVGTLNTSVSSEPVFIGGMNSITQSSSFGPISNTSLTGRLNGNVVTSSITLSPNYLGLLSYQKTSSTLSTLYKNNTDVGSGNSGGALPDVSIYIGVLNINGVVYSPSYVNNSYRLTYISDGLSSTDMVNLYTAVQAYQTTLGRQVV